MYKAINYSNRLTKNMYASLSETANVTSDSICVFLKLFNVNDSNQRRLVKFKMVNIFKPTVRQALLRDNSGSTQGIFGGDLNAFKNLEETKKQSALLKTVILKTKKPGKAGNAGAKRGKKPAAKGGSKGKGKKSPRKRSNKKGPKKDSNDSKEKEEARKADKKSNDPCKLVTHESFTLSHPSSHQSCGYGHLSLIHI